MSMELELELQYERIDWGDIVEAELSGDQEALRELRERAAEMKREEEEKQEEPAGRAVAAGRGEDGESPVSRTSNGGQSRRRPARRHQHHPDPVSPQLLALAEHPVPPPHKNKENTLPFANFNFSPAASQLTTTTSYAQIVSRKNAKRTLGDRCLSPSEVPIKRATTSDLMKTPTEFRSFVPNSLPSCDTTPETGSLPGKAGMVQRRLFEAQTQQQQQVTSGPTHPVSREAPRLTDSHKLSQRQKQIDFGKNTLGYERYIQLVPKWKRQKTHPVTPDKTNPCSTRSWQGQMRVWRRQLHKYDPAPQSEEPQFSLADAALCNISLDQSDP